jgi:hypothetical protein
VPHEHVEDGRRLGRRAPSRRPALRLGPLLTAGVPAHPITVDHLSRVFDFELYRNDQFGDCGPVSVANSLKALTVYADVPERSPSQEDVFDLYRRSGNPRFDPATGADDNGVDMQTMLEALLAGGIGGYRPVCFAQVDHTNLDELRAAVSIFGVALLGVDLQVAQQDQTYRGLWDYSRSAEWGGHAVAAGAYTSASGHGLDVSVVTWGDVLGTTDEFLTHQLDEAWVVIWPEHLSHPAFQAGIDLPALASAYRELTGRTLPLPGPTPGPAPAAGYSLLDRVRAFLARLAQGIRNFIDSL